MAAGDDAAPQSAGGALAGNGLARVILSGAGRELSLWADEAYGYVMLFTGDSLPEPRRSLAVEPMTCPPNAFQTGEALIRLEPGGSFTCSWGIAPPQRARP